MGNCQHIEMLMQYKVMDIITNDGKKVSFEPYVLYARNENKYPKRDFIILMHILFITVFAI